MGTFTKAISFTFKALNGTAWVQIKPPPNFGIAASGIQLSTTTAAGVAMSGLQISSTRVTVTAPAAVDNVTVKVFLVSESEIPAFIGGDMSLPTGTTLAVNVDNGPSETVQPGSTWSIGTST